MTLSEALSDPTRKAAVIRDGAALIDSEVASKSGLSGMALKAGYKTIKRLSPGMIGHALGVLLPEFAPAIDPHYAKAKAAGDVQAHFIANSSEIAEALLAVTDGKARRAQNRVMLKVYNSLRGQAKAHVQAAMPGLARMIAQHV